MFEIEFSEPGFSSCDCCGKPVTNVTRFVTRDGRAWAVYKATFGKDHAEKGVYLAVGIDESGGADWTGTSAFALHVKSTETEFETRVTNAEDSPWRSVTVLGRILNRAEALSHPELDEIFHLVDHVMQEDPLIRELFETVH
jgi:hypothetical protein